MLVANTSRFRVLLFMLMALGAVAALLWVQSPDAVVGRQFRDPDGIDAPVALSTDVNTTAPNVAVSSLSTTPSPAPLAQRPTGKRRRKPTEAPARDDNDDNDDEDQTNSSSAVSGWSRAKIMACAPPLTTGRSAALLSFGDSHGRQMVESVALRLAPLIALANDKHSTWIRHYYARRDSKFLKNVSVGSVFDGRPKTMATTKFDAFLPSNADVHILMSRGAWDTFYFGTSLQTFYNEVLALLQSTRGIKLPPSTRVTLNWRAMHIFGEHEASHFKECTARSTLDLFRRFGVCAVAAFNNEVAAPEGHVRVFDFDPAIRDMQLEPDNQHVGHKNSGSLTDALFLNRVCPAATPTEVIKKVWWSEDSDAISRRFDCPEIWKQLARHKNNSVAELDRAFGLSHRYGCMCADPVRSYNDVCVLSHQANYRAALRANQAPFIFYSYVCHARRQRSGTLLKNEAPVTTNLSSALLGPLNDVESDARMTEVALEVCVNPALAMQAFQSAGYQLPPRHQYNLTFPADVARCRDGARSRSSSAWCLEQQTRLNDVADDVIRLLRQFMWMDNYRLTEWQRESALRCQVEITPRNRKSPAPRVVSVVNELRDILAMVCHPGWIPGIANRTRRVDEARRLRVITGRVRETGTTRTFELLEIFFRQRIAQAKG